METAALSTIFNCSQTQYLGGMRTRYTTSSCSHSMRGMSPDSTKIPVSPSPPPPHLFTLEILWGFCIGYLPFIRGILIDQAYGR